MSTIVPKVRRSVRNALHGVRDQGQYVRFQEPTHEHTPTSGDQIQDLGIMIAAPGLGIAALAGVAELANTVSETVTHLGMAGGIGAAAVGGLVFLAGRE